MARKGAESTTEGEIRLSHSSATKLLSCEQAYVNYKVLKKDYDPDYTMSDALSIGKAFHYIQETCKHEKHPKISEILDTCQTDPDILLKAEYRFLLHGMSVKYWRLHKKSNFKIAEIEIAVKDSQTIGYIDAIMFDPNGKWWIVDLKANRTLALANLPALPYDPQLNLYASFKAQIAKEYNLVEEDFAGTRWRVTTKPNLKRRATETDVEYTLRIVKSTKTYDIAISVDQMNPTFFKDRHLKNHKRAVELHEGAEPTKNYANCMSYFSPCEYWSQCHGGKTYSDTVVEVIEEK